MHGHWWTTLNGNMDTLLDLVFTMLTLSMVSNVIQKTRSNGLSGSLIDRTERLKKWKRCHMRSHVLMEIRLCMSLFKKKKKKDFAWASKFWWISGIFCIFHGGEPIHERWRAKSMFIWFYLSNVNLLILEPLWLNMCKHFSEGNERI